MIYPNSLTKNSTIKIISPSNGVKQKKIDKYEKSINKIKEYGLNVIEDKYVRCSNNGVSSSAANRSKELNNAFKDDKISAMIACSGGDYIIQILDMLNFKNIKKNPKWIQGHSDITALLYYITTKYDIATIYNFNVRTFGNNEIPTKMCDHNIEFLMGKNPIQEEYGYVIEKEKKIINWKCINNFKSVEGRIIGGCLPSLKDIIGTKYDKTKEFINRYKEDGIIWYFDIVEMTNEDILRTLWQLKQANWFKYCKCILFGRLEEEITYTDTSLSEAIKYNLNDLNIPIIINVDIGHTDPVFTIINGSLVRITKQKKYMMETILK